MKLLTLTEFCQFILYCHFSIPGSYIAFSCDSLVSSNLTVPQSPLAFHSIRTFDICLSFGVCLVFSSDETGLLFSHSVMSESLKPHGLQHARLPYPSPSPRACSNSCLLSWWCHPSNHLILCHPFLLLPSVFPSIRVFSNGSALCIWWPKYWSFSFSISTSNAFSYEYHRSKAVSFSEHHFRGCMMLAAAITGNANLEQWVRVVSVGFLHRKITVFPFVIDTLHQILWHSANTLFPLQLSPTDSNIQEEILLQPLLLWYLPCGDFFPLNFFSPHSFFWNSFVRKNYYLSYIYLHIQL